MGVRSTMRSLLDTVFGTSGAGSWEFAQNWSRGVMPSGDDQTLTKPYIQHPVVGMALELVAEDAASVPLALYRRGPDGKPDGEAIEQHPLLELLRHPNPLMDGSDIWITSNLHYLCFGEWFWYAPDGLLLQRGGPRATEAMARGQVDVLYPPSVLHKVESGEIKWALRTTGADKPLQPEQLFRHRRINPYDPIRGVSKLSTVLDDLRGDSNAAAWNRRFFGERNGTPGGLLKPPLGANFTPDQRKDVLEHWNQRHGGGRRSIGVLPGGWDFLDQSVTQRDMDFRALRDFARELALGVLGVPPFMAGVLDKANYANARKQEEVYWLGTIKRFLDGVRNTLNYDILPRLGLADLVFAHEWDEIRAMIEDYAAKVDAGTKLWAMGVPLAEINRRLNLRLDESVLPDAEIGYVPAGMTPTTLAGSPPPLPPTPPAQRSLGRQLNETRKTALWRRQERARQERERSFEKAIRWHFRKIRKEVEDNLEGPKGVLLMYQRGPGDQHVIATTFDREAADAQLRRLTEREYRRTMERAGSMLLMEIGVNIDFDLTNPRALALLGTLQHKITAINATVERQLRDALIETLGSEGGTTIEELRNTVQHVMDVSLGRSRTIAQTEVGHAFNGARNEAMKQAGVERAEWISARDGDVRESHQAVDGETIAIGETFSNGLQHPNDPAGPPEEVINCRCVSAPVITEGT